jgi:hypothetical protein
MVTSSVKGGSHWSVMDEDVLPINLNCDGESAGIAGIQISSLLSSPLPASFKAYPKTIYLFVSSS